MVGKYAYRIEGVEPFILVWQSNAYRSWKMGTR